MSQRGTRLMGIEPRVWEVACVREPTIRRLVSLPSSPPILEQESAGIVAGGASKWRKQPSPPIWW